ncbi:Putative short-chain dehydrogenase/reductase SDR, NAD(P)-binding domain superfamily [Colletotrichum destructivum]|uniref:Short-chain dehydrogenase/reductase SDR, NAD(P)-binding domain superfamily n=1 Tax=Colletotrichum destructivum TaxID=34406 RepID=A0AAX4IA25_9PEZI|nr:Putative short-chain dehydrogenase/reductase SDR, NAD(P)-binding domain superfamily [Colletotrichum destructivum]
MRNMKDGGSIVNVGSITSSYASAGVAAYVACKRVGPGMTKIAAFEGVPPGASASIVYVREGRIDTEIISKPFESPAGQFGLSTDTVPCITKRIAEPWEIATLIAAPMPRRLRVLLATSLSLLPRRHGSLTVVESRGTTDHKYHDRRVDSVRRRAAMLV